MGDTNTPGPTAPRPVWGAVLLALGHVALLCRVLWTPWDATLAAWAGPAVALFALPALGVVAAVAAVGLPGRATRAGLVGTAAAVAVPTVVLLTPVGTAHPRLLALGLVVAGVGGVVCTGRRRLRPGPFLRVGQVAVVAVVAVSLALSAPAASADAVPYPQEVDNRGGFVVYSSSLFVDRLDITTACPDEATNIFGVGQSNGCIGDYSLDSTAFPSGGITYDDVVQRQQLQDVPNNVVMLGGMPGSPDIPSAQDGQTDFVVYKNYNNPADGQVDSFEITGDFAYATSPVAPSNQDNSVVDNGEDNDDRNAIDAHIHEIRLECAGVDANLLGITEALSTWITQPGAEGSADNSVNDVRSVLGIFSDARPIVGPTPETRDISLSVLQLGSTTTAIDEFNLSVRDRPRDPVPAVDEAPLNPMPNSNGVENSNCPAP